MTATETKLSKDDILGAVGKHDGVGVVRTGQRALKKNSA